MEDTYKRPIARVCPRCGSAVADGFDACPGCGCPMPTQTQTSQNPSFYGEPSLSHEIPEGSTIVKDRKEYFSFYLPRQHYRNIIFMAIITQFMTLLLGLLVFLGDANNVSFLFIIHSVIVSALGFWLMAKTDLVSSALTLAYTVLFFFISLGVFDTGFWYPILGAVLALLSIVKGDQNWKAYCASPIPLAIISNEERRSFAKAQKIYRTVSLVLAIILLIMGGVMVYLQINDEKLYEDYSVGQISGNVYTNDFADITFTAPEGWSFLNEDELEEYNQDFRGYSYDIYAYASIVYAYNAQGTGEDFMVIDVTQHERASLAEEYFSKIYNNNHEAVDMYGNTGTSIILDPVVIGGHEYKVLHTFYSGGETEAYDGFILVRSYGRLTYEIYFYPQNGLSFKEFLACFD